MLSIEHLGAPMLLAALVAPVAVYFLLLGLLNSRPHPQLLSGRRDFALLAVAFGPLFVLPVAHATGGSPLAIAAAMGAVIAAVALLGPRGQTWVIYNLSLDRARRLVRSALEETGVTANEAGDVFALPDHGARLEVGGFALLRNVSIRLIGVDRAVADAIVAAIARRLRGVTVATSPSTVALLLVATAMLVAPLAVVAQQMPQIVRLLTDLLP
jgi:hypothetical protein